MSARKGISACLEEQRVIGSVNQTNKDSFLSSTFDIAFLTFLRVDPGVKSAF